MPEATDFYMPILRWKRGEQVALHNLHSETKQVVDPLFVIEPLEYDPPSASGHDASFDLQLEQTAASISRYWNAWDASIDLFRTDEDARYGANQEHFLEKLFELIRTDDAVCRPVITLGSGTEFRIAVRNVIALDERGCTLRIGALEIDDDIEGYLDDLIDEIACQPEEIDLVIDSGNNVLPTAVIARIIQSAIDDLPYLARWRTLTVAAGSFPPSLADFQVGTRIIPRNCLLLWQAIRQRAPDRLPALGDYAIIHPEPIEVAGFMNPSASVKYTIDDGWLLLRGQGTRTPGTGGFGQFLAHAQNLIQSQYYCGPQFSWGDEQINEIAAQNTGCGNLETWVRIGVNHHIEFVVDRLASYAGP